MSEPLAQLEAQYSAHLRLERSVSGKIGWTVSVTCPEWSEAFVQLQAADAAMTEAYGPEITA
jgi:hypothetical protein